MKSVLITGSEGFLGRHLAGRLLEAGWSVHGIDRAVSARSHDRYEVEQIDVLDARRLAAFVAGRKFDAVVHLAAPTTHEEMVGQKTRTLKTNVQGTINLLDACKASGAGTFVYASTGKVYGRIEKLPISEAHPTEPLNILGKTKIIAEKLIEFYCLGGRCRAAILRIFNVYGPGQRDYFLVPTILTQLARGESTVTLGNVADRRDYVYVEDVAGAIAFLLGRRLEKQVEIFNIGSAAAHSAADVVGTIGRITGQQIGIAVDRSRFRKDESPVERADTGKLAALGWRPAHSLEEGLRKTVDHYLGALCKS